MQVWPMRDRVSQRHSYVVNQLDLPLKEMWRAELNEPIHNQAVADEHLVYVISWSRVHALNRKTGATDWTFSPRQTRLNPRYSGLGTSPLIWEDRLYFTDFGGVLYCLDRKTGALLWEQDNFQMVSESLCVYQEQIFVRTERTTGEGSHMANIGGYLSLTLNGNVNWFIQAEEVVQTKQAAVSDDVLIFGDRAGLLYGIDTRMGQIRWRQDTTKFVQPIQTITGVIAVAPYGTPVIVGSAVLVRIRSGQHVSAFDLQTGARKWVYEASQPIRNVACNDHYLYFTSDSVGCVDIMTGQLVWSKAYSLGALPAMISESGLVVGKTYFAGFDESQQVMAFDTQTGNLQWEFTGEGGFLAPPICVDTNLIICDDSGFVYCFESA